MKQRPLLFLLLALAGCDDCDHDERPRSDASSADVVVREAAAAPVASVAPPLRNVPRPPPEKKITYASLADVSADPPPSAEATEWFHVVVMRRQRAFISGAPEDLLAIAAATETLVKLDDRLAANHVTRAESLVSLGKNADAQKEIARAIELGARGAGVDLVSAKIDWQAGRYGPAIDRVRATAASSNLAAAYLRLGVLEHQLGDVEASDRAFERAEDLLEPDKELELAEIYFHHGVARLERGRLDEAAAYLRAALARVPEHAASAARLAEVLDKKNARADAFAVAEPLLEGARDPALLAIAARVAPPAKSGALKTRARARFEELLAKTPDVVYLSAAEAFLEWNDAKRAAALLTKEIEARPTALAFEALARAQLATGDTASAKVAIERALHSPYRLARIDWTAARVYSRLGESGKSNELAARARKSDPTLPSSVPGRGE